ncbi:sialidase family protein [Consotaella salsifontis]|uniref:Predicted neuraminidase (Sialidase) n=1 Tax=Consotaella salsifontis TaxID=1365950 RepID=A0A1T4T1H0_9HYPH|nr:exo-alpha-sialidase [Consotaella salsifontis]SKA34326.1 Predicted neuraminidase (sialidase) [Consotaella salsifontis]
MSTAFDASTDGLRPDGRLVQYDVVSGGLQTLIPSPCVQNHAANLARLPDGDLACVWFGGTQEGIPDISIWMSRLPAGADAWEAPVKLSEDASRSEQNPVLFNAPDGKVWLLWTAQINGRQDTSIVRARVSEDSGRSWGPIHTLIDEPGTFIRQPIVVREDGTWLLPVFLCHTEPGVAWVGDADTAAVKISQDQGRSWRHVDVPDSLGAVHMNIVPLGGQRMVAFFRSRWADFVRRSWSEDGGESWSPTEDTELPNNNSSIQVRRLPDGRLAMVHNFASRLDAIERRVSLYDEIEDPEAGAAAPAAPAQGETEGPRAFWGAPRAPMTLSLSADEGRSWPVRHDLEEGDGYCMSNNSKDSKNRELSYPSILATEDGRIHVAYTWFRKAIKYLTFEARRV